MIGLLFSKIISLFIIMACGYLLVKFKLIKSEESKILSKLCVYIFLPCNIIEAFQVEFTKELQEGLILSFSVAIILHLFLLMLSYAFGKIFKLSPIEKMAIIYSNAGNLVIPLITSILGEEWVIYSSAFIVVQNILLWTHCKMTICGEKSINLKTVFKNFTLIVIFISILMMVFKIKLPTTLDNAVCTLKVMIGPTTMLISGMIIARMDLKSDLKKVSLWLTVGIRLVVVPILMLFVLKAFRDFTCVENAYMILMVSYFAIITPSASTIINQAQFYGGDVESAGLINALSTLLCTITMPLMLLLYELI